MSYKLKAIQPINKYLNTWLKMNGFKCRVEFDSEFSYDFENQIIHYSVTVPKEHDEYYFKLIQFYQPDLVECDNFILSFFHELGHYKTEKQFSETEWQAYQEFVDKIENSNKESCAWEFYKYYMHPIEIAATEWGANYIINNPKKIRRFIKRLNPLIINFIDENEIELDDEKEIELYRKYKEELKNE